jgi:methyl-accepting chemotaxis protein
MNDAARVTEMLSRIDDVVSPPALKPPDYGASQRQAISAIADDLTSDLNEKVGQLHRRLDELEQTVLKSAAEAKAKLTEMVTVCAGVSDEVDHIQEIIEEIARRAATVSASVRV